MSELDPFAEHKLLPSSPSYDGAFDWSGFQVRLPVLLRILGHNAASLRDLADAFEQHVNENAHADGDIGVWVDGSSFGSYDTLELFAGSNVTLTPSIVAGRARITVAAATEATASVAPMLRAVSFEQVTGDVLPHGLSAPIDSFPEPSTILSVQAVATAAVTKDVEVDLLVNGSTVFGTKPKLLIPAGCRRAMATPAATTATPLFPTELEAVVYGTVEDGVDGLPEGEMLTVSVLYVPVSGGSSSKGVWDRVSNTFDLTEEADSEITDTELATPSDGGGTLTIDSYGAGGKAYTDASVVPNGEGRSLRLEHAEGGGIALRHTLDTPQTVLAGQWLFRMDTLPGSIGTPGGQNAVRLCFWRDGSTHIASLSMPVEGTANAGKVQLHSGNGASLKATSTNALDADKWYRFEYLLDMLAGTIVVNICEHDSDDPIETLVGTGLTGTQVTRVERGKARGTGGENADRAWTCWIDGRIDGTRGIEGVAYG